MVNGVRQPRTIYILMRINPRTEFHFKEIDKFPKVERVYLKRNIDNTHDPSSDCRLKSPVFLLDTVVVDRLEGRTREARH